MTTSIPSDIMLCRSGDRTPMEPRLPGPKRNCACLPAARGLDAFGSRRPSGSSPPPWICVGTDGRTIETLPHGFYLRATFTAGLLRRHSFFRDGPHRPSVLSFDADPKQPHPQGTSSTMSQHQAVEPRSSVAWRDYYALCKPKVVALIVLTAVAGMLVASPGEVPLQALVCGTLGIALAAASAAVINQVADH
ncbi:MAG: hypothetical protein ACREA0_18305, partial [bacterium]